MFTRPIQMWLAMALAVATSPSAFAQQIAVPTGAPILTITGPVAATNVGDALVFDRDTLASLPATTIETSTIWTEGTQTFTGVSLMDLAEMIGASEGAFLAMAINDYTVEIPVTDAVKDGPIIAYLMDGAEMSVREKGPLWVIYPYDSKAAYRSEVIYSRSIWQLDRIEFAQTSEGQ